MVKSIIPDNLFGITKNQLIEFCLTHDFPGTYKWQANHPIWYCNISGHLSPKEAWNNDELIKKAVDNLFYITYTSMYNNKYPEFVNRIENAFFTMYKNPTNILREVLLRFTVAKIAPKVTALMPSTLFKIINDSGIDISAGTYCPMAGFGGIIEGVKRWFKAHNLDYSNKIEAYDINENLCSWYGWNIRDALAQVIYTDKVVIACPPFGNKTEKWLGTPENMYYDFSDWCNLLKSYIIAPNYIFIGPEINEHNSRNQLFAKKIGVQYYSEYSK